MTKTPRQIGRYEVIEEIGHGMMGLVFRARDPELDRVVALKTVRLAFAVSEDEQGLFEKRFLSEARAAAALSHPGIVTVHDVGRDAEGTLYIALEHLEGRNLDELTRAGQRWEWRDALRFTARVARALHHAHAHGIVHRDIKPANIMVLPSGEPKVMDFGIAKVPTSQLTAAGELFGTPLYMSPEQAAGEPVDGRSDLFSLGAVLYLLLTGKKAFDADGLPAILARVTRLHPPPPSTITPGVPTEVDAVVARALAKNASERYPDGNALAAALEGVLASGDRAPSVPGRVVASAAAAPPSLGATADLPATGAPALRGPEAWWRQHRARVLGGATACAVLAALLVPGLGRRGVPRIPGVTPLVEPGHLEIELEHPLRSGLLKVWIDGELLVEEPLESRVTKKVLFVRTRKGREEKLLDVAPGEREIKVEVTGDDFSDVRTIRGSFTSGATRRLLARVEGLLNREMSLFWGT